jgi:high-affinity Fe2+/Pb2+ permease
MTLRHILVIAAIIVSGVAAVSISQVTSHSPVRTMQLLLCVFAALLVAGFIYRSHRNNSRQSQ